MLARVSEGGNKRQCDDKLRPPNATPLTRCGASKHKGFTDYDARGSVTVLPFCLDIAVKGVRFRRD